MLANGRVLFKVCMANEPRAKVSRTSPIVQGQWHWVLWQLNECMIDLLTRISISLAMSQICALVSFA